MYESLKHSYYPRNKDLISLQDMIYLYIYQDPYPNDRDARIRENEANPTGIVQIGNFNTVIEESGLSAQQMGKLENYVRELKNGKLNIENN